MVAFFRALGPGLVTGASDDDPSGIATYAQAGAKYGVGLLWTALITLPLMTAVQEICDRTALTTGESLGEMTRGRFDKRGRIVVGVLLVALILANTFNIAADLVAVGAGMQLLGLGSKIVWAVVSGMGLTVMLVLGSFEVIARVFKYVCLTLLAYIAELVVVHVQWGQVLTHLVVPHVKFDKGHLSMLVALLGTTISPYLFFWESAHRVEEMREEPHGGKTAVGLKRRTNTVAAKKLRKARTDVASGMVLSNVVMFAIIVVTAFTLAKHGQHSVSSPAAAASALKPVAGRFASAIFALGFIGSGVLAVPVLAGAGASGLAGLTGRTEGYSREWRKAPIFYGLVAFGTLGGAALALVGGNPMSLLVVAAALNGVAAAPFLVLVMLVSGDKTRMGKYVNGWLSSILGWGTVALMTAAAVALAVVH